MTANASRAGFAAVDEDHDAAGLVAALDEQAALPAIARLRAAAIDHLALEAGQRVLDAGCGTGDITRRIAAVVGPGGVAVGVDSSTTMLDAARRRTSASLPVELHLGDLTALAHADTGFDAAYCERVLQHLPSPESALAELVRVTRPGGRIVVIDTDWGMHAIGGADPALTRRVVHTWSEQTPNGCSGRRLPALFAAAGLIDLAVTADTITCRTPVGTALEPFATMARAARARGVLTRVEAKTWLTQLADAAEAGSFLWAVTLFLVAGTRPPA